MSVTIVVGAQWGDEGKGKIVDLLAAHADLVIRFNGGNNAGHTIKNEFGEFALHLIPAGIFNPDATCLIERGVVIHPPSLVQEMKELEGHGISLKKLRISPFAHLVMPWHMAQDCGQEGGQAIGTTLRGIGPCYQDKVGRWNAIRVADLLNKQSFLEKLEGVYKMKKRELRQNYPNVKMPSLEKIRQAYLEAREYVIPYIENPKKIIQNALFRNKNILLEAAQGTLLDVDYGSYPYVTSSSTTALAGCMLTGISPKEVTRVIGIAKAYVTRVGNGPFPTEIKIKTGDKLREAGHEFGATTGRARRCGWLDLPLLGYASEVNHFTEIALTKLDILGLLPVVKLCHVYRNKGGAYVDMSALGAARPIYEIFEGWGNLTGLHFRDELPHEAQRYLRAIEQYVRVPIRYVSIGGKRKEVIVI